MSRLTTYQRRTYDDDYLVFYGKNKVKRCKRCRRLESEIKILKQRIEELEEDIGELKYEKGD
jgi:predicted  nucleic acid-binding Zn-ribbon protein